MTENRTLRIGLVGASSVATFAILAPAEQVAGVDVIGVASRDLARAQAFAKRHALPRVYADYDEMIACRDVDLLYIGTWPVSHAALAIAGAEAGKAVLIEKPVTMDAAEARRVRDAAALHGTFVAEAMHSRHHRLFRRVQEIVAAGRLGRIHHVEAVFDAAIRQEEREFRWRAGDGGGALMDLGVYPLAWVRGVLGQQPAVTAASMILRNGVDAETAADLSFPDGATAHIRCSMLAADYRSSLHITGEKGELVADNPLSPQSGHSLRYVLDGVAHEEHFPDAPSTFVAQLTAVRDTVVNDAPFLLPPDDFVASMMAIDAVRAAAAGAGPARSGTSRR